MKYFLCFLILTISTSVAVASSYTDVIDYYNNLKNQYIKPGDQVKSNIEIVDGATENKWFWTGKINNKNCTIYANSKKIELIINAKITNFMLRKATTTPRESHSEPSLDRRGIDFFIKENKSPNKSIICISSLMPGSSSNNPFSQVYLIISPTISPTIIKQPRLNASCLSVSIDEYGTLQYPVSKMSAPLTNGSVTLKYYQIKNNGISPKGETTKIEITN